MPEAARLLSKEDVLDEIITVRVGEFHLDPEKEVPCLIIKNDVPEAAISSRHLPSFMVWILPK